MSLKMASPLYLIFLFMISGALGNKWSVKYSQLNLCALKGSTVFINGTYTHPTGLTVKKAFWLINPVKGKESTDLYDEPGYSSRLEYLGDEQKHFSLRLRDVKKTDEHMYCFRIITNKDKEKFLGFPGVTLTVTDLQVITPAEVTEGQSAVLTCKTTCSLTDPTFLWYKNKPGLTTKTTKSNEVHLQRVSSEDAGSYSCAVRGYEHLPSPAKTLSVRYPPKKVSVSISSSGEIVEGSSVTLTCSSDANPPVENYTWFKGNESSPVGSGQSYRALQSGQYYCKAQNKHGSDRSAAVSITLNGESDDDNLILYNTVPDSASANQDEVLYARVVRRSAGDPGSAESSALKASGSEDKEVQYASIRFTRTGADYRSFPAMMSLRMASPLYLIFLFLISGALGNEWSVKYSQPNLCAIKGSTVFMNGTYTHPTRLTVKKAFWLINPVPGIEPTDLRNEPGYSDRVEYLGDEQKHFSLRLRDVKKTDEHMYCFRIITNEEKEKFLGFPGVTLTVTDLQVIAPAEVTEGQSAVLTCKTTCSLTDPTFVWYKNRRGLTTKTTKSNKFHLQRVSSEDAGSYSCAVRGYEHLPSPAQTLSVRYPPKNVSVSISSSGEIVEGSSVTLTCSSDANPPVEIYTWFKGTTSVGKGKAYIISKIRIEHSGKYKCKCSNEVGHQDSIGVTLNVLYPPKNVSVSISSSGEIVEGSSVTLTCSSDANPPVEKYTWFKEKESSPVGSGQSYRALQSGQYYCKAQNKHGSERSAAVSVTLNGESDDVNL
ncbi:sialoadhesin-like [Pangasianodon hypophthalmus]|uniref:sialoadhesin-like n=1 Tax=Pangasianodon hypophthalmus TaxID=310915 RepID=UPI002306EEEA|nr:sialoadhesin-like [Pangasianodon hypophthalmus]